MSPFLELDVDPVDQPAAKDPLERATWSALRIRADGRTVTRMRDATLNAERTLIYVPVFPIAQWIVDNWWALANEPCPAEEPAVRPARPADFAWAKRHCLRSAAPGLVLPSLWLYDDGLGLRASWVGDDPSAVPHATGWFTDTGSVPIDRDTATDALATFVTETLDRVRGIDDPRVREVDADWMAIRRAAPDEVPFCRIAGRMGLDPYDDDDLQPSVAALIETQMDDADLPWLRDVTEVSTAATLPDLWDWVSGTRTAYSLGAATTAFIAPPAAGRQAHRYGYALAHLVRQRVGLDGNSPIDSIEAAADRIGRFTIDLATPRQTPGPGIRGMVGWSRPDTMTIALPGRLPKDSARFLAARGLCHGLFGCDRSERVVTGAYTWDQKVSRAFAAELLAPQRALVAMDSPRSDDPNIGDLAEQYGVSPWVISLQLQNAGMGQSA